MKQTQQHNIAQTHFYSEFQVLTSYDYDRKETQIRDRCMFKHNECSTDVTTGRDIRENFQWHIAQISNLASSP